MEAPNPIQSELGSILSRLALRRLKVMTASRESTIELDRPDEALPWDMSDSEDGDDG
jgi:hypothetical protein